MSKFLMWLVFNVQLGKLAPYVFGIALGGFPKKIKPNNQNWQ